MRNLTRWRRSARPSGAGSRPPSRGRRLPRPAAGRRSPSGANTLICAPTGSGKTLASFLWGIDRLSRAPEQAARGPARLRLAAEGALLRHRAQPAGAAAGDRRRHLGRPAHRRHAPVGAAGDAKNAARNPHHHARVALPDALLVGPRDLRHDRGGDRRRDPRGRAIQAGVASGADAGAARPSWSREPPAGRPGSLARSNSGRLRRDLPRARRHPADRALRDPAAVGADGAVPRRAEAGVRDRRCGADEGARPGDRRPGRGHGGARARRTSPTPTGVAGRGRAAAPTSARSGPRSTPSC